MWWEFAHVHKIGKKEKSCEEGVSRSSWWNTREDQGIPPPKKTNSAYIEYILSRNTIVYQSHKNN